MCLQISFLCRSGCRRRGSSNHAAKSALTKAAQRVWFHDFIEQSWPFILRWCHAIKACAIACPDLFTFVLKLLWVYTACLHMEQYLKTKCSTEYLGPSCECCLPHSPSCTLFPHFPQWINKLIHKTRARRMHTRLFKIFLRGCKVA